jgi:ferredoxin-type protein NapH
MYPALIKNPLFLIGPLLLPVIALFFGPLFCGWLCPAGSVTEFLGRLVPDRFKLFVGGKVNPAPIRYGVLVGMLVSPFLGGYVCCTFCNFTMMQNVVHAVFGNPAALTAWSSFTLLTFVVWLLPLGLFLKGGRGFCNFLCPAGAVQGFFHAVGAGFGLSKRISVDESKCTACHTCVTECPAFAVSNRTVNPHACNLCLDCLYLCKSGAVHYQRVQR